MDFFRMMGALLLVLGAMVFVLWLVRKYNLVPGAVSRNTHKRMEIVERLGIDQKRSAILLRLDDKEHLVVLSPEGVLNVASVEHSGRVEKVSQVDKEEGEEGKSFASVLGDVVKHAGLSRRSQQGA